jgi:hypothetical protein
MDPFSRMCSDNSYWSIGREALIKKTTLSFGLDLFSHTVTHVLSSALGRFTILFGMGSGGSTPLQRPKLKVVKFKEYYTL